MQIRGFSKLKQIFRILRDDGPSVPEQADLPKDTVTIKPLEDPTVALTHKPPTLRNPVILMNGLARDAHEWDKLVPWLTSNPENKFGAVYQKGGDSAFRESLRQEPEAKIFVLDPADNLSSPRVIGGEIRRMIDHIVKETGAEKVDIVAHSQGGLNVLAAVDQGEDQIGKVVSLATPWKGAAIASLARTFDGVAGHKMDNFLAPLGEDRGALLDLRPIQKNDWLRGAHERLQENEHRPQTYSLIGSGTPTPGGLRDRIVPGDGFVSVDSGLGVQGAQNFHLPPGDWKPGDAAFRGFHLMDVNHIGIVGHSTAFQVVGQALNEQGVASEPPVSVGATEKSVSQANLDHGEDLIHDHLRDIAKSRVEEWTPWLDEVHELRQDVVENDMDFRAADLRQSRGKWLSRIGAVGALVGVAVAGPIVALPGLALGGYGLQKWVRGALDENRAETAQGNLQSKAMTLQKEIEAAVAAGLPPVSS